MMKKGEFNTIAHLTEPQWALYLSIYLCTCSFSYRCDDVIVHKHDKPNLDLFRKTSRFYLQSTSQTQKAIQGALRHQDERRMQSEAV